MNRELLHGWRTWFYRGEHRQPGRLGHEFVGLVLYASVRLR